MAQNISWKSKTSNEKLYNGSPKATDIISERMLNLARHCIRHKEEMAHNLILWIPTRGKRRRGRKEFTFIEALQLQTDLEDICDDLSWRIEETIKIGSRARRK